MKIKELLEFGKNNLIEKEEPYRMAKMLMKNLLNVDDTYLLINSNEIVKESIVDKYKEDIRLLKDGMPIQYIINKQEFMGLEFYIDNNVLIPQPDTEILVEEVMNLLKKRERKLKVLDLCTGSGAIGVSIAKNIEDLELTMSDISEEALKIASKNAKNNEVIDKCNFIKSDIFENIKEKFDVIVSNPPYIKSSVINTLSLEVQNEPIIALDGGEDGLYFYKKIIQNAYKYLREDGLLALEIGYDQKKDVINLLRNNANYKDIYSKKDLSGNDRIVISKLK